MDFGGSGPPFDIIGLSCDDYFAFFSFFFFFFFFGCWGVSLIFSKKKNKKNLETHPKFSKVKSKKWNITGPKETEGQK